MHPGDFKKYGLEFLEWMDGYFRSVREYPVLPKVKPGDIKAKLPAEPPSRGESIDELFRDFKTVILPGMTHWQHPDFYGYFPAGRSEPSVLAEMLTATLGAQCMIWLTSPAAEELEERMMEWLRSMYGLPSDYSGVIQDTASTATLVSLLTAREVKSGYAINRNGYDRTYRFRVYASEHAHSSVDKAVRIAGIGHQHLVKIKSGPDHAMLPDELERAIAKDVRDGYTPLAVIGTFGTTATAAVDPLDAIGAIARRYNSWYHVDAAYAGTALILPDMRRMAAGIDLADTIVINPHKWMLTNFDCTAYFVRDKERLIKTFAITPEYLKTDADALVNNYRDWGIQLGRRFRALKLWFVIRHYGTDGLRQIISDHIEYARWLEKQIVSEPDFEILAPVLFSLVCFRYHPPRVQDESALNTINENLLSQLNQSGRMFLTHTKLKERYTLRLAIGNSSTTQDDIRATWNFIKETARCF